MCLRSNLSMGLASCIVSLRCSGGWDCRWDGTGVFECDCAVFGCESDTCLRREWGWEEGKGDVDPLFIEVIGV